MKLKLLYKWFNFKIKAMAKRKQQNQKWGVLIPVIKWGWNWWASSFIELNDTPGSFSWQAGKTLKVNASEDWLEFTPNTGTDEKVWLNALDVPGYLEDKIDWNTIKSDWTKILVDWSVLDVNKVDGKDVNDNKIDNTALWTAKKIWDELNKKVDKVVWKWLSTNDFTDAYKNKLDWIEDWAEKNVQSDWNQIDNTKDDYIKNKPDLSIYEEKANKVSSWQTTPDNIHYPSEKLVKDNIDDLQNNKADKITSWVENNFVSIDNTWNIKDSWKKADDFANATHTHNWTDVNKTWSKLSDIEDVPAYTGNAGKLLAVNNTEDWLEWVEWWGWWGGWWWGWWGGWWTIPNNPYAIYKLNWDLTDSSWNWRDLTLYIWTPTYKTEWDITYVDTRSNKIATRMDGGTLLNQWTFYVKLRDVGTSTRQTIFGWETNDNIAVSIYKSSNKYVINWYKSGHWTQYSYASDVNVDWNWHKLAISYNNWTIKIYMDWQFKVSKSWTLDFNCNTFFSDEYNSANEPASWEFDDIIVYDRVLTDSEAKSLTS